MPRPTYNQRKGRRRPSDQRGTYSRAQVAQLTDQYIKKPSTTPQGDPNR